MTNYLLTSQEMFDAENKVIQQQTSEKDLMERAGQAVARIIQQHYKPGPTLILCGHGKNGGDGYVAARYLKQAGFDVHVSQIIPNDLHPLTLHQQKVWQDAGGNVDLWNPEIVGQYDYLVDAIFGIGFQCRGQKAWAGVFRTLNEQKNKKLIAIDCPSGVEGSTGRIEKGDINETAVKADLTVTFFHKKRCHVLLPARRLCGKVVVADIGIPDDVLESPARSIVENTQCLWLSSLPWPDESSHKYRRGHVMVIGGMTMTGAPRLSAQAAQRIGAGLVTLAYPYDAMSGYNLSPASILLSPFRDTLTMQELWEPRKVRALLFGPGAGQNVTTRERAIAVLKSKIPCVLDADALSVFAGHIDLLCQYTGDHVIITPHEGELERLIPNNFTDKISWAIQAAEKLGVVLVLKGADTIIARPDGYIAVNTHTSPFLATGGSGDVLAGIIVGLLAQGMDSFKASCAAVYMHGEAALQHGPGLIAEDIINLMPKVLRQISKSGN